jgi:hypothetical protein
VPLWWCVPCFVGFLTFLFAFPIDRHVSHWFPLNVAELFTLWFLFVTPVTTVIAIVTWLKRTRTGRTSPFVKLLVWTAIGASLALNGFVLLGMWAAFAF